MKRFQKTIIWQEKKVLAALLLVSAICLGSSVTVAKEFLYVQDGKEYYKGSDGKILTVDIPSTLTFLRREGRKTYYQTYDGKVIVSEEFGSLLPGAIPDYDWWYGCSPTSTGMMMGYYDLNGYNSQPYTNLVPGGNAELSSYTSSAPLANATIASSTYISDYWVEYGQSGNDPCPGCHADNSLAGFMETGKDSAGNLDGGTTFSYFLNNAPFTATDIETYEIQSKSGMYGIGEWVKNAGYNYTSLYNQRIYGIEGVSTGFTFDDFKAEIDAGRPVLIHVTDHTMIGVGYSGEDTIYVNDTWSSGPHTMTWGGTYDGLTHEMVTCLTLTQSENYTLTVTKAGSGSGTVTSDPAGISCGTDCSEAYNAGTQVTLTATPDAGSTFTGWTGGGCSGTGTCTVMMNSDTTVTATFSDISPSEANWTFMVYLDGDNNLEGNGIDDFLEMASVGSSANVNILVQFDRIPGEDDRYGDWTDCKRFYVTSGMTPTAANAIQNLGEVNMGEPATLTNFINWGSANYPAEQYAVILWNHGGGWREQQEMLLKSLKSAKTAEEVQTIRQALKKIEKPGYKAVCWDDTNGHDTLYMKEVKAALNTATVDTDLLGFDACLMGMVEVAYEVKATGASVMVGSEASEPVAGWPYNTLLTDLVANPTWTPAQFGTAIVNRYYESYPSFGYTQSAIDLGRMNALAGTIDAFAYTMNVSWNTDQAAVKEAAQLVMNELELAVIHEQHGHPWIESHGAAIYFPLTQSEFDPDYNGSVIDFPADTAWDEFLANFYASMTNSWIAAARRDAQFYDDPRHIDLYDFCDKLIHPVSLNCENAIAVTDEVPYNGTTVGAPSNVNLYNCTGWYETGPEVVHTITTTVAGDITATLSNLSVDLDVFILDACSHQSCAAYGDEVAVYADAPPGTYYIVVDGYLGASGSYTLTVDVATAPICLPHTVCNGDFEQGLTYWSSTANATLVYGRSGYGVLVSHDDANSDVYQFMKPDPVLENNVFPAGTYQVSAWCRADVGEDCGLYLGDANTWYNPPDHEREVRRYLPGNGQWQEITALLTLDEPELLSVYLYASKPGSAVVYDDVSIQPIPTPTCADRTLCNGDFEQGLAYWRDLENAALTDGRSGWGLQIDHDDANSDAFQFMNGVFEAGKRYQLSAWCLADVGEDCGLYLGDANTWYNPPDHEREVRAYAPGTGHWQYLSVTLPLDEAERLSAYLYASQPGSSVIYDDVQLREAIPYTAYLAEGYTDGAFDTYIPILNPHEDPAQVDVTFLQEDGATTPVSFTLPGLSRKVLNANSYVPNQGFSVTVTSDRQVAVERAVYWGAGGEPMADGHAAIGMTELSPTWYLAEGYNSANSYGFTTYLLLVNPHDTAATANVTLMQEDGTLQPYTRWMPARSRQTINTSYLIPEGGFAIYVEADQPILAERAMYWNAGGTALAGGHDTIGITFPANLWYFAEGYNSSSFDTYILLMNPNDSQTVASVTFMQEDGTSVDYYRTMPAHSRQTITTSAIIPSGGFATKVSADQPILAERAMYWTSGGTPTAGGHNTIGASQLATTWYLAEGYVGGNYDMATYLLLLNPNPTDAQAALTFVKDDGTTATYDKTIPAASRRTITAGSVIDSGGFGTIVESDIPIMVERAMYWDAGGAATAGGHCSIGVAAQSDSHPLTLDGKTLYRLTVTTGGSGGGTVTGAGIACGDDCTEWYAEGTVLNLKAVPDADSEFTGWLINGEAVTEAVPVDDEMIVTAVFERRD